MLQGTAKAGSDYTAPANLGANNTLTVTFAAGSATATLSLPTLADNVVDPYDNIVAILQPGNGYSITPGSDRAEVIIQAEGVTAVPNRRSYWSKNSGEYINTYAFAALKADGSVVTWGLSSHGGDSSSVAGQLSSGVVGFATPYTDDSFNNAPTFNNQTFTLAENTTNNTLIGTLSATDPEEDNLTYSITNNPDPNNNGTPAFRLQGNRLLVNDQEDLNYETNPTLSITAQASDGSFTNDATITVNLTDVNEKPTITSPNTVNVPENTTEVLTVQVTDPEGDSLTFSIIGGADANLFQINPNTGNLSFKTAPDFENPASAANTNTYQVQVAVTDNSLYNVQVIRVAVTDVNEAPTFNNQTFTLLENTTNNTLIGTLSATDPEEDNLTYSITNNPDPNNNGTPAFLLQGNRLLVNDQEDLNYETNPTLSITAQASDGSFTNDATITVNLTDVIGEYRTLNNLNHIWQTITLNESYTNPVIIVGDPTQGQSSSSFQVAMQEEEARNSGSHAMETIGWLAIEQGVTEKGDPLLEGGTTSRAHAHTPSTVSFSQSFDSPPSVIAKLGSYYEGDTANLRLGSITSTGFEVRVHEEQSPLNHTTESISFLALEGYL